MKIAIISDNDLIWSLPTWERVLLTLKKNKYVVTGFWTCPPKLANIKDWKIPFYYLHTFGFGNFFKLSLFTILATLTRWFSIVYGHRVLNFKGLCAQSRIPFYVCQGPNDPLFYCWVQDQEVDVVIIMCSYILKDKTISSPKLGIINKHAALLPANKGLFPYFWARLKNQKQGVSFHMVVRKIDGGKVLAQEYVPSYHTQSMIDFYFYVYRQRYADMLIESLNRLSSGQHIDQSHNYPASYHGLPTQDDYIKFRKQGGKIIRWRDVLIALKL